MSQESFVKNQERDGLMRQSLRMLTLSLLAATALASLSRAQGPVFSIVPGESTVKFFVKASVAIEGKFDKWDATLTFHPQT